MAELEIAGPADHAGVKICRMACIEKSIPHMHRELKGQRALRSDSPFGILPVLRHGKVKLFGVRGITSYIDANFKGRNLLPSHPIRAAEVEQWTAAILQMLDGLLDHRSAAEAASADLTRQRLDIINDRIGPTPWLVGRAFTLADLTLMPAIGNLCLHSGHDDVLRRYPAIALWFAKHATRRSWQAVAGTCSGPADA